MTDDILQASKSSSYYARNRPWLQPLIVCAVAAACLTVGEALLDVRDAPAMAPVVAGGARVAELLVKFAVLLILGWSGVCANDTPTLSAKFYRAALFGGTLGYVAMLLRHHL